MNKICQRLEMRMECPECDYPLSEAALPLDPAVPHGSLNVVRVQVESVMDVNATYEQSFTYEEMIELLAAIRDTPIRGNELFDSAKAKARKILHMMPVSNY
jgi:hypothetical protein